MEKKGEYYGKLIKQEQLLSIDGLHVENRLVYIAPEPFPGMIGYYSDSPHEKPPLYVYLVLDKPASLENTYRASEKVIAEIGINFEFAKSRITFSSRGYDALRIRKIDSYTILPKMIKAYEKEGLKIKQRESRDVKEEIAQIEIRKFFYLEMLEEGIWVSVQKDDHGYIVLPREVCWEEFEELVGKVKNNWNKTFFDASLGVYFNFQSTVEVVRIYAKNLDLETLKSLRKLFLVHLK